MMKRNMGVADRVIRIVLAVIVVALYAGGIISMAEKSYRNI